jgi:methionine synthase II (cobalamin-independent)
MAGFDTAHPKLITEKKVVIGAIDHHTLQVETPQEVDLRLKK